MIDFKELIDCIRKEEVTLFIGSGFSLKPGAPSATNISNTIIDAMNPDERDALYGKQLDYVTDEYEQIYGREQLLKLLEKSMRFTPTDMTDHLALTKVPHFHTIITTNYDTLLEDTYGNEKSYVVRYAKDCVNVPKDKTIIYKIHGDFTAKDNIVVTKQDYTNFFVRNKDSVFWNHIVSQILTKDILFIGYSLEDSNIFEIMKKIKNAVDGNTRRFFLIAPGLKGYKVNRLAKANVKYYDCKAEALFPQLFETLDRKIQTDYNHKKISLTTLTKYSKLHNLSPVGTEKEDKNCVHFNPIGKECNWKINFAITDKALGDKFLAHDSSLFTSTLPNNPFVPSFRLEQGIVKHIDFQMNGMTVGTEEDISCLYVAPAFQDEYVTIRISESNIIEKIKMTRYSLNNTLTLKSELEGYVLTFEIRLKKDNEFTCTCNITLSDSYKNNSEALRWVEIPIALWSGKEFTLSILPNVPMRFNSSNEPDFNTIKQYYSNVQEIEMLYGVEFSTFECFSPEAFEVSKLLIHSYKESVIPLRLNDKVCTLDIDGDAESIKRTIPLNKSGFSLALTQSADNYVTLNGQDFTIKQRHTVIQDCTLIDVSRKNNNQVCLKIQINSDTILQKFSDKDLSEVDGFNHFKQLR